MPFIHRRPLGQPTRGKTAPGRLRQVDAFLALYAPGLFRRADGPFAGAPFVDLGYGATPITTLESAARFRSLNPALPVVGVEIDRALVEAARPYADALTDFRWGGFNLPLGADAAGRPIRARLIRAFNVLRQYEAEAVGAAWAEMAAGLAPGGLLIEGSSDPSGRVWVANLLWRSCETGATSAGGVRDSRVDRAPHPLAGGAVDPQADRPVAPWFDAADLVFGTRFRQAFDPEQFKPVLPKNLIHRMDPGEPIHAFFEAWARAWQASRGEQVWGPRRHLAASVQELAEAGYSLDLRRRFIDRGFLIWRSPPRGN